MGKVFEEIDEGLNRFIEAQHVFFVATAPRSDEGLVNLSPKGLDTFRILAPTRVAYLVQVDVRRIADSCGYGVPRYDFVERRQTLVQLAEKMGPENMRKVQAGVNDKSLDGLPGLHLDSHQDG